ncbi:radical SAM protein [Candidatus Kuenenbacteria bacterium]|nr:radical SAM protein [Candidatus Kuenenbacteria bacterium]
MPSTKKDKFIISPHLVIRKHQDDFVVYHALFGNPLILNSSSIQLLNIFETAMSIADVNEQYSIEDIEEWLDLFMKNSFLTVEHGDERSYLEKTTDEVIKKICSGKQLSSLGLILDEACNFDCAYCISKKVISASDRKSEKPQRMTWAVAKKAVDRFVAFAGKNHEELEIYFGGSEPLLNWQLMKKVIEYCLNNYGSQYKFTFSTNTNSSLITAEKAKFLGRHKVTITTSLDGQAEVNDKIRRFASGKGTFKQIISGWDNLSSFAQKVEWICLTLTEQNIDQINEEFFDFLSTREITSCSIEPDIICSGKIPAEKMVSALLKFKEMGAKKGISVGGLWDKPLKNMFEDDILKKLFNCSAFTGRGISVLATGDIVPCSYSATKVGHIDEFESIFSSALYRSLVSSRIIGKIETCKGCEIEGQCIGGCYITTEYGNCLGSDETFIYRCEIFKKITQYLLSAAVDCS